jgi:hypothetical protein
VKIKAGNDEYRQHPPQIMMESYDVRAENRSITCLPAQQSIFNVSISTSTEKNEG